MQGLYTYAFLALLTGLVLHWRMPKQVAVLGIPMDLGAGRRGVDMGPSALRLAGLDDALAQLGLEVTDLGNVEVPVPEATSDPTGLHYVEPIVDACRSAYERLRALDPSHVPVVLGGDHSITMGSVAGIAAAAGADQRIGVLWVDAHADLNVPGSSPSGNIHGMPLAHLLGAGDERLTGVWGGGAVLEPRDVVYLGLRSIDPYERERIVELGIRAYTMTDLDQRGVGEVATEALAYLAGTDRLHVSFDADALDPEEAPGVGTPVPGGLSYREAHLLMELLCAGGRVTSLDLVEVNPILDVRNKTARIMVELAASLLGKKIL